MDFSVIIPVYNVEKYIKRCLDSIINQDYINLEIILVDDGSTDASGSICDEYSKIDDRIVVIHKKNEGLGMARNSGMDVATGEYIAFVDSDDYLEQNSFEILFDKIIEGNKPDACLFGHNIINQNEDRIQVFNYVDNVLDQQLIKEKLLPRAFSTSLRKEDTYGIGSAWGGVYNRKFINDNGLRFLSEREILSEDLIFSIEVCLCARKVSFVQECLYNYCVNTLSLSHSYRKDRFEKSIYLYKYMNKIADDNSLTHESYLRIRDNYIINLIVCLKQEVHKDDKYTKKRKRIIEILNTSDTEQVCNKYPLHELKLKTRILVGLIKYKAVDLVYLVTYLREQKLQ